MPDDRTPRKTTSKSDANKRPGAVGKEQVGAMLNDPACQHQGAIDGSETEADHIRESLPSRMIVTQRQIPHWDTKVQQAFIEFTGRAERYYRLVLRTIQRAQS